MKENNLTRNLNMRKIGIVWPNYILFLTLEGYIKKKLNHRHRQGSSAGADAGAD